MLVVNDRDGVYDERAVARACEPADRPRVSTREGVSRRSEAEGDRRGWGGVRRGAVRSGTQTGSRERGEAAGDTAGTSEASDEERDEVRPPAGNLGVGGRSEINGSAEFLKRQYVLRTVLNSGRTRDTNYGISICSGGSSSIHGLKSAHGTRGYSRGK